MNTIQLWAGNEMLWERPLEGGAATLLRSDFALLDYVMSGRHDVTFKVV